MEHSGSTLEKEKRVECLLLARTRVYVATVCPDMQ